jgi:hypothetical protein
MGMGKIEKLICRVGSVDVRRDIVRVVAAATVGVEDTDVAQIKR